MLEAALQIGGYQNVPLAVIFGCVGTGCVLYLLWPVLSPSGFMRMINSLLHRVDAWRVKEWLPALEAAAQFSADRYMRRERAEEAHRLADSEYQHLKLMSEYAGDSDKSDAFERSHKAYLEKVRVSVLANAVLGSNVPKPGPTFNG